MADVFLRNARRLIAAQSLNLVSDTIKAMLVDDTFTLSETNHVYIDNSRSDDPVDKELTASGYSRQTLSTKAITDDGTRVKFTADNIAFGSIAVNAAQKAAGVIFYKDTGTATTSPIIAFYDVADIPTNGSPITFNMPTNGFINF